MRACVCVLGILKDAPLIKYELLGGNILRFDFGKQIIAHYCCWYAVRVCMNEWEQFVWTPETNSNRLFYFRANVLRMAFVVPSGRSSHPLGYNIPAQKKIKSQNAFENFRCHRKIIYTVQSIIRFRVHSSSTGEKEKLLKMAGAKHEIDFEHFELLNYIFQTSCRASKMASIK